MSKAAGIRFSFACLCDILDDEAEPAIFDWCQDPPSGKLCTSLFDPKSIFELNSAVFTGRCPYMVEVIPGCEFAACDQPVNISNATYTWSVIYMKASGAAAETVLSMLVLQVCRTSAQCRVGVLYDVWISNQSIAAAEKL